MKNYNIKDNLDEKDIINEINLASKYPNNNKIFIICEGKSDRKLISKFLDDDVVEIMESNGGKIIALKVLEHFLNLNPNVIGILDRDYSSLSYNNLFFYDNCCLEMMLLGSDNVFRSLCTEYEFNEIDTDTFLYNILRSLKVISILRKYNEENNGSINFRLLNINTIFKDDDKYYIDDSLLWNKLIKNQNNINYFKDIKNDDLILYFYNICTNFNTKDELLQITNGHDFCDLFTAIYNEKEIGKHKGIKSNVLESALRLSFNKYDFKATKLYNNLRQYEKDLNINFIKLD